jgi:hypothetical protein
VPYALASAATLCLVVYCALNVITTPEDEVRNLPKLVWLLLVLFFPVVGGISWLVAGRPQGPVRSLPYKGNTGVPPRPPRTPGSERYDGHGTGRPTPAASAPDDDEAFLRDLRARAEEQRAVERRRRAERERRDGPGEQRRGDGG